MSDGRHVERLNVVLDLEREADCKLLENLRRLPDGMRMHVCRWLLRQGLADLDEGGWAAMLAEASRDQLGRGRKRGPRPGSRKREEANVATQPDPVRMPSRPPEDQAQPPAAVAATGPTTAALPEPATPPVPAMEPVPAASQAVPEPEPPAAPVPAPVTAPVEPRRPTGRLGRLSGLSGMSGP
jgi:hypothetical protein